MKFVITEEEKNRIKKLYENSEEQSLPGEIPELKNKTVTFDTSCDYKGTNPSKIAVSIKAATYFTSEREDGYLYGRITLDITKLNDGSGNKFTLHSEDSGKGFTADNGASRNYEVKLSNNCKYMVNLFSDNLDSFIRGLKKYPVGKLNKVPPKKTKTDF